MEPDDKLWHPMSKKVQHGTSGATIYHRLHNFSLGYAILVPGYKFRGCQFEILGYTRTVGGQRGLSYPFLILPREADLSSYFCLTKVHHAGKRLRNSNIKHYILFWLNTKNKFSY